MKTTAELINNYLDELKAELRGMDKATVQDALADAEEHLRTALESEKGDQEDLVENEALARIIEEYGACIAGYIRTKIHDNIFVQKSAERKGQLLSLRAEPVDEPAHVIRELARICLHDQVQGFYPLKLPRLNDLGMDDAEHTHVCIHIHVDAFQDIDDF